VAENVEFDTPSAAIGSNFRIGVYTMPEITHYFSEDQLDKYGIIDVGECDTGLQCDIVSIHRGWPPGTLIEYHCPKIAAFVVKRKGLSGPGWFTQRVCEDHMIEFK